MKLSYGFLSFNNWPVLKRTLESAKKLQHSCGDVQWVIVDNSTPQYCQEVMSGINQWIKDNPHLHIDTYSTNGENLGEGTGMNKCFNLCTGENILFFQDDWECVVDYPFIDLAIETLDRFENIFMVQLSQRDWSIKNINIQMGRLLMVHEDKVVSEMKSNNFGNNTFQVRLFKKSKWKKVGLYLEDKNISPLWAGHRPGSVSERDYGLRLQSFGYKAARINTGQFKHLLEEDSRVADLLK